MQCLEPQKQKKEGIKDLVMKEINNLTYRLEINFVNNSGIDSSICVKFHDNGLESMSVRVGDICITKETINGKILGEILDNSGKSCGYRYDYQNGENLLNTNPSTPLYTAINLIHEMSMTPQYLSARLVLSSVFRNDYRVVTLNEGKLNIIKTISAENENSEQCCLQETINLSKQKDAESFVEQDKTRVYLLDGKHVEGSLLSELSEVVSQNPQSYKELIELKKLIEQKITNNSITEEHNHE